MEGIRQQVKLRHHIKVSVKVSGFEGILAQRPIGDIPANGHQTIPEMNKPLLNLAWLGMDGEIRLDKQSEKQAKTEDSI